MAASLELSGKQRKGHSIAQVYLKMKSGIWLLCFPCYQAHVVQRYDRVRMTTILKFDSMQYVGITLQLCFATFMEPSRHREPGYVGCDASPLKLTSEKGLSRQLRHCEFQGPASSEQGNDGESVPSLT